jgi:cellulose synthase/poly-beta-1,6-N-acetylglucosamine synthase-like glycosyltransferase
METAFWMCVGLIVYTYFGYPLVLLCLRAVLKRPVAKANITPSVSLIIAAHNEERDIRTKLENTFGLDYPREKMQVIVASDCSTDGTDAIVRGYEPRGVLLVRLPHRGGKTAALNEAVKRATGDILVFSDAPTLYRPDTIRKLVRNFADDSVGCVTGEIWYTNETNSLIGNGGSLYWKYESWLRRMESDIGSVLGMAGCIYALRRELYVPLGAEPSKRGVMSKLTVSSQSLDDDFLTPLGLRLRGAKYRAVMEPEAICVERVSGGSHEEFRMRSRVIARAMVGLMYMKAVLNPVRFPLYSFQIISHKVLRWLAPVWLIGMVSSNSFLLSTWLYQCTFAFQLGFYGCAVMGYISEKLRFQKARWLYIPYYFCVSNLAALVAVGKFVVGKTDGVWTPVRN